MDEKAVQEVKKIIVDKFNTEFGFCGVAEGEKAIMLNSGEGNIIINIKWE